MHFQLYMLKSKFIPSLFGQWRNFVTIYPRKWFQITIKKLNYTKEKMSQRTQRAHIITKSNFFAPFDRILQLHILPPKSNGKVNPHAINANYEKHIRTIFLIFFLCRLCRSIIHWQNSLVTEILPPEEWNRDSLWDVYGVPRNFTIEFNDSILGKMKFGLWTLQCQYTRIDRHFSFVCGKDSS